MGKKEQKYKENKKAKSKKKQKSSTMKTYRCELCHERVPIDDAMVHVAECGMTIPRSD
ncbi:MAG: hypothetical protein HY457_03450 [Parcubacteria group bacterium]|nr:hypothetical protein [Parcubacteria group bacterium]